jgi:hypothetical protein
MQYSSVYNAPRYLYTIPTGATVDVTFTVTPSYGAVNVFIGKSNYPSATGVGAQWNSTIRAGSNSFMIDNADLNWPTGSKFYIVPVFLTS